MIRYALQDDLKSIFRTLGKTVVLVTHEINEADFFAGTIVLMRAGQIVQRGTLGEFAKHPRRAISSHDLSERSACPLNFCE